MKYYQNMDVFQAAKARLSYLFDEFPNVVATTSGGKDSTVILNLTLAEAERRGRLPLRVLFVDQEAEWQTVIDYHRRVKADPRVDFHWLQMPMRIANATSTREHWLNCWEDGKEDEWVRPKEPDSIHVNDYGTITFKEIFGAYARKHYPEGRVAMISGVRAEESPSRMLGLTAYQTYKWITWGKKRDKVRHYYDFYVLYDWSYTDVWKAIHQHGWDYCKLYDYQYQRGIPVMEMRVSNVHHATAVRSLFVLQEFEPRTWNRIVNRLHGVNTAGILQNNFITVPDTYPPMFSSWQEYRDYLVENLAPPDKQPLYRETFAKYDEWFAKGYFDIKDPRRMYRLEILTLLTNDWHLTKMQDFRAAHRNRKFFGKGVEALDFPA